MSLWLVGKKRSITLMAAQSANGIAMNMTTRIAISRLAILFIFPPASNRYLRSTLIRNISLPRDSAPREAAIRHRHKKKPRTMPGLELPEKLDSVPRDYWTTPVESVVYSNAGDVIAHRVARPERYPINIERIDRPCAQIDEKILALHRPKYLQGCPNGCTGEGAGVGTNCLQPAGLQTGAQDRGCRIEGSGPICRLRPGVKTPNATAGLNTPGAFH